MMGDLMRLRWFLRRSRNFKMRRRWNESLVTSTIGLIQGVKLRRQGLVNFERSTSFFTLMKKCWDVGYHLYCSWGMDLLSSSILSRREVAQPWTHELDCACGSCDFTTAVAWRHIRINELIRLVRHLSRYSFVIGRPPQLWHDVT